MGSQKSVGYNPKNDVKIVSGNAIRLSELVDTAIEEEIEKGPLRIVLSGGTPAYANLRRKWDRLGVLLVETYGQSELGGAVAIGYPRPFKYKSINPFETIHPIGPPLPDKEVRIVDSNDNELSVGTPRRDHPPRGVYAGLLEDGGGNCQDTPRRMVTYERYRQHGRIR